MATTATMAPAGDTPAWRGWLVLGVAWLVAGGIVWLGPKGLDLLLGLPAIATLDPALLDAAFNTLIFGTFVVAALIGLKLVGLRLARSIAPALGAPVGLLGGSIGVSLALAISGLAGVVQQGQAAAFSAGVFALGTAVTLLQSGAEELFFRGFLQRALVRDWGRWWGVGASAACFALVHFIQAVQDPLAWPMLILGGLWFGILAERSGGLVLPIAAHFGWNWTEAMVLGASPNPGVGSYGSLLDYDLAGPALWGGSPEGLNTALSAMTVLTALIVVSILMPGIPAKKPKP